MRTSGSVWQFLRGKTLSLKDLQPAAKTVNVDYLGRPKEINNLKCRYCKKKGHGYGTSFVCDKCKKIREEENAVTVVLEREKRLKQRRAGEV